MRCPPLASCLILLVAGLAASVLQGHLCAANEFCLLEDDRLALAVRAEMIRSARCEISLAYYAIDAGEIPLGLLSLLCEAANRGVVVRVVVDGLQSRLPADFETMMVQKGVEFRKYHPPYKGRPDWLNRRLHCKLLVVDRQAMVLGSRNLQDDHFGQKRINYIDSDVFLAGSICKHAAEYFDWLWQTHDVFPATKCNPVGLDLVDNLKMDIFPVPFHSGRRESKYHESLAGGLCDMNKIIGQPSACTTNCFQCVSGVNACLLHDGFTSKTHRKLQTGVVDLLDDARESIHLETAYPVFSPPIFDALCRASCRGVRISLLTNSLESTDTVSTYAAYQNQKAQLLRMGMHLYELCGRDHLHVKTLIIDRRLTMLGSYNFDVRSDRLNLEFNVVVRDPRVAEVVMQAAQRRLSRSQKISGEDPCPEVAGNPPLRKQVRMRVTQAVVPLYRRSL